MEEKGKIKRRYSTLKMLEKRDIGQQLLTQATLISKYYKHIKLSWSKNETYDAVFNLEFSPSGKILVAACEESAILMYDPLSRRCLHRLPNAHDDCVNCISFCDERMFASGSDDCSITLWDARMLNKCVMKLSGHTDWVKSLVYDHNTDVLLSSSFDGTVRAWDINGDAEQNSRTIFSHNDNISRMQLTPGGDKLIISCPESESGPDVILIFHNFDLENFVHDIKEKWMNEVHPELEGGEIYDRNIAEKLDGNLEYLNAPFRIPSFQVHPHGSCLVSRYFTWENIPFAAVHDIQISSLGSGRRLTHYIQESDSGRGFIKELCFSPDGRVIASPFAHGARILAFDPDCSKWRYDSEAKVLNEVKFLLGHSMPVCCCRFSPSHMLLATGCLAGRIAFHEPKL